MTEGDGDITEIARDYLRATNNYEAKRESLLSEWAEEYYRPGYLNDDEWDLVKELMDADDTEHAFMQIEIAIYRKVATEEGRAHEFDDEWPAKP